MGMLADRLTDEQTDVRTHSHLLGGLAWSSRRVRIAFIMLDQAGMSQAASREKTRISKSSGLI